MIGGHPKILIIRLSAIGDVVRVLPAATAIRQALPGAQIDWVVEPAAADILTNYPAVDRVFVFNRRANWLPSMGHFVQLCSRLRDHRYDVVLDFHGILKSGLLSWTTGAKRRISFDAPRAREGSHRFANERVPLPEPIMNRVDENLALAKHLDPNISSILFNCDIDKQFNNAVCEYVRDRRTKRPWLAVIHPFVERAEKQWKVENFSTLIERMHEDGRFDTVLIHGPNQRDLLDPILERVQGKVIVPPVKQSLRELAGFLSIASLFVGLDSGPMHIAAAVGSPVVAIFGGTDPRMHTPIGAPVRTLGGVAVNERTDRASDDEAAAALASVSPQDVLDASIELLGSTEVSAGL